MIRWVRFLSTVWWVCMACWLVPFTADGTSFFGQLAGALTIFVWVFGASLIVWLIIKTLFGLRVTEEQEYSGVDITECGMEAYPEFTTK